MASESLPDTHRTLVLTSRDKPLTIEKRPVPTLTSGSAIVRVLASQVISYAGEVYSGKRPYPFPTPFVPGTSCVARVVAVGPDATSLKPGKLVYIHIFIAGRDDPDKLCLWGVFSGDSPEAANLMEHEWRDSSLAEYARVPMENCIPLDEKRLLGLPEDGGLGYTIEDLAYLQTPLIAYGGLIDIDVKPGETVIVAPATGGFGGSAVQVALAMGAGTVIAMGRNEAALERVRGVDPTRVKTVKMTGNLETELEALKAFGPIDAFFDISPPMAQNSTHFKACIASLRRNGRASLMGGMHGDLSIPFRAVMHKNLTLKGKWMYEREDIAGFMRLIHSGLLKLGPKAGNEIVGKFGLEGWKEAFDLAAEKAQMGQMVVMIS
ncbi:hypothetical protein MMC10_006816 [Thelotrema lepadinum]|nr:hypothetical protein [Thelotrema lepadinum]